MAAGLNPLEFWDMSFVEVCRYQVASSQRYDAMWMMNAQNAAWSLAPNVERGKTLTGSDLLGKNKKTDPSFGDVLSSIGGERKSKGRRTKEDLDREFEEKRIAAELAADREAGI